jgi:glycosyltransferase involved in cell wall biosynthesis
MAMEYLPEEFRFYIGGTGKYQNELMALIEKLDLVDRVKLLGFVSEEDKYRWMKTCDLFVNLSSIEAFGITVLEALAAGAPAVVNAAGGLVEFAESFKGARSINIDAASPDELADFMEKSVGEQVKDDLNSYDWRNIAYRVENAYMDK